ncbi:MAG TPA: sugar-binding protein [Chitinispirillaceae bacterium]|nr:sugar-binding protein [Chitinispirillaceae bacterium]
MIKIGLMVCFGVYSLVVAENFDSLRQSLKLLEKKLPLIDSNGSISKKIVGDSAKIIIPAVRTNVGTTPFDIEVVPRTEVDSVQLFVRHSAGLIDTLGTAAHPPYRFNYQCSNIPDQDQIHFQFGYTLFRDSGETIVSPPLPHRWMVRRGNWKSHNVFHAHQITTPDTIIIDGSLDDWKRVRKTRLGKYGYAKMVWTIGKVYFAAHIQDTSICTGDFIELHFDMYNDKSDFAGKNHRSIRFGPKTRSVCFTVELNDSGFTPADSSTLLIKENMEWRTVIKNDGYIIEAAIPFFTLSDLMYPSMVSGFDITINDANSGTENQFYSWGGNKDQYCRYSPARWGTLKLHQAMASLHLVMLVCALFFGVVILGIIGWLLYRHYTDSKIDKIEERHCSEMVGTILTCIREHLSDTALSIDTLTEKTGFEKNSVVTTIETEAKCSLDYLILKERIALSKKLLSNETFIIDEIIRTTGFKDQKTFENAFVEMTKTTPQEFYERKRAEVVEE